MININDKQQSNNKVIWSFRNKQVGDFLTCEPLTQKDWASMRKA